MEPTKIYSTDGSQTELDEIKRLREEAIKLVNTTCADFWTRPLGERVIDEDLGIDKVISMEAEDIDMLLDWVLNLPDDSLAFSRQYGGIKVSTPKSDRKAREYFIKSQVFSKIYGNWQDINLYDLRGLPAEANYTQKMKINKMPRQALANWLCETILKEATHYQTLVTIAESESGNIMPTTPKPETEQRPVGSHQKRPLGSPDFEESIDRSIQSISQNAAKRLKFTHEDSGGFEIEAGLKKYVTPEGVEWDKLGPKFYGLIGSYMNDLKDIQIGILTAVNKNLRNTLKPFDNVKGIAMLKERASLAWTNVVRIWDQPFFIKVVDLPDRSKEPVNTSPMDFDFLPQGPSALFYVELIHEQEEIFKPMPDIARNLSRTKKFDELRYARDTRLRGGDARRKLVGVKVKIVMRGLDEENKGLTELLLLIDSKTKLSIFGELNAQTKEKTGALVFTLMFNPNIPDLTQFVNLIMTHKFQTSAAEGMKLQRIYQIDGILEDWSEMAMVNQLTTGYNGWSIPVGEYYPYEVKPKGSDSVMKNPTYKWPISEHWENLFRDRHLTGIGISTLLTPYSSKREMDFCLFPNDRCLMAYALFDLLHPSHNGKFKFNLHTLDFGKLAPFDMEQISRALDPDGPAVRDKAVALLRADDISLQIAALEEEKETLELQRSKAAASGSTGLLGDLDYELERIDKEIKEVDSLIGAPNQVFSQETVRLPLPDPQAFQKLISNKESKYRIDKVISKKAKKISEKGQLESILLRQLETRQHMKKDGKILPTLEANIKSLEQDIARLGIEINQMTHDISEAQNRFNILFNARDRSHSLLAHIDAIKTNYFDKLPRIRVKREEIMEALSRLSKNTLLDPKIIAKKSSLRSELIKIESTIRQIESNYSRLPELEKKYYTEINSIKRKTASDEEKDRIWADKYLEH